MMNNETDIEETAQWFLKEKQDVWAQWLPEDKVEVILFFFRVICKIYA